MIQKVESTIPNSLGDIDLPHQAPARSGKQKPGSTGVNGSEDADERDDAVSSLPPLRPRHLGKSLDLIA